MMKNLGLLKHCVRLNNYGSIIEKRILSSLKSQNKKTEFLHSLLFSFDLKLLATNIPKPPKEEKKLIIRHHTWY